MPLDWFFSDGVVLEMRHKDDGDPVTVGDVENELERIGYTLKPLDIVLVRNGRDRFYGDPDYRTRGCGVTAAATRWLYDRGIRVMGIDAWGWDKPLDRQAEEQTSGCRRVVETVEVAVALVKADGFEKETDAAGNETYTAEISYPIEREHLLVHYEEWQKQAASEIATLLNTLS